jgi:heterodisulfide reductase subunit B
MRYALFLGCRIPSRLPAYEASTRAVLARLDVGLADLDFACCGNPVRGLDRDAFAFAAARNLALAERAGLDILAPCKCCFGALRHAARFLGEDAGLRGRVARLLAAEGLSWSGGIEVEHLLTVLGRRVGLDAVAGAVRAPRTGLRVAASYGCHALRPETVTLFDNPLAPTLFESLVRATGATAVDWPRRLDCCGDPLHGLDARLSGLLAAAKLADARERGAEVVCTACPHCHLRFEATAAGAGAGSPGPARLLYPQLLGLAMGIDRGELGL